MTKINKKSRFFEKVAFTAGMLSLFLLIGLPLTIPSYVKVDDYINNSQTVELNQAIYIDWENVSIGASQNKDIYTIKADNMYYGLEFYQEGTRDHSSSNFSRGKVYERVFIKLNPMELDKHQGTIEDPIPVYNYGVTPNEFVWDESKYEYNIRTHRAFEEILHFKSYEWLLWVIFIICLTPLVVIQIKRSSEANARGKVAREEKKRNKNRMNK
ncbi:hypothetical protein ACFPZK_03205 [Psychrobacter urativorans]|uniref:hypothetical protein n=1 Tax=Psychrobacter urativorans TaxID=45610 RepID=UPI001919E9FB|nr:hypothetical protein [Psychrobacter urativorans]